VSTVWLNTFGLHVQQMAGTPVKQSGYGSLAGSAAIEAFQNIKRYGTARPHA
jgi:acyl-CoA reductase-like NAD-dependent aldehyde dehydrogenase